MKLHLKTIQQQENYISGGDASDNRCLKRLCPSIWCGVTGVNVLTWYGVWNQFAYILGPELFFLLIKLHLQLCEETKEQTVTTGAGWRKTFTVTTGAYLRAWLGPLFWRSAPSEPPPHHAVLAKSELTQTKETSQYRLRARYGGFQSGTAACLHLLDAASEFPVLFKSAIISSNWFLTPDGNTHVNQIRAKAKNWIVRAFSWCSQLTPISSLWVLPTV